VPRLTFRLVLRLLGALLLGVLVGAVGTVMHRSERPWGVVVCLLLVLAAAVAVRAASDWRGALALLIGLFGAVQVLSGRGPGGDVLVPADGAIGWVWTLGALAVGLGVALAPRAWFADVPLRRRAAAPAAGPAAS
jgi:hypothetical protein